MADAKEFDLVYAGIGSRETPLDILQKMRLISATLGKLGWCLRSGGAKGADTAFEEWAPYKEIHRPTIDYLKRDQIVPEFSQDVMTIARLHHPNWVNLSDYVKLLMARNVTIVLGKDLRQPANMVICWTPGGKPVGGTSHAMRVADTYQIPIFNLAIAEDNERLAHFVDEIEAAKKTID